jgi:hypothetical protein
MSGCLYDGGVTDSGCARLPRLNRRITSGSYKRDCWRNKGKRIVSREVGGPHPDGLLVNGDIIPLISYGVQHPTIECSGNMHGNCEK